MNNKPILTLLLATALLLSNLAVPTVAAETKHKEKGIYGSLKLTKTEYRAIETSGKMHDQFQRRGLLQN